MDLSIKRVSPGVTKVESFSDGPRFLLREVGLSPINEVEVVELCPSFN